PDKCVSRRLSTAAFAARTAVERVRTRAHRFPSSNALTVNAFHDLLDLRFFDGEVGDVEAVHDLLDGGGGGELAPVDVHAVAVRADLEDLQAVPDEEGRVRHGLDVEDHRGDGKDPVAQLRERAVEEQL